MEPSVEQQDARGWTPIMWSSCNGYPHLVRKLIQQGAQVGHFGQARNGVGTTSALHECAAMSGEKGQSAEAYYECAWLLMAAGQSPFKERSDGATAIDVAARFNQRGMKAFLEGCALFRGNLMMAVPVTFGTKQKNRYCIVHPRFPFTNAAPSLWMTCYRGSAEIQPTVTIPLGNARVVVEGPSDSGSGILIIPSTCKLPKGVAVRSHTQNSAIVEITALGTSTSPAWKTLRTLADVTKAAGVAISCHSLDQLCAAALRSAVKQMHLPGTTRIPQLVEPPAERTSEGARTPSMGAIKEEPQIADSAQEMTEQAPKAADSLPPRPSLPAAVPSPPSLPETPRTSDASRRSSGIGRMFKSAFRMSSSSKPRYSNQLLDSSSSLGQNSIVGQEKKGLFGMRKSNPSKSRLQSMPSINEQHQPAQQNIPDKFWSKMGRKLSTQNGRPMTSRENIESWFHEEDGIVSPTSALGEQSGNYEAAQDLNELMFPTLAKEEQGTAQPNEQSGALPVAPGVSQVPAGGISPDKLRRQTSDGARFALSKPALPSKGGPISFTLEEPIVSKTVIVPSGPRRSFSFDDLDEFMTGASRGSRAHRESYANEMGTAQPKPVSGTVRTSNSTPAHSLSGNAGKAEQRHLTGPGGFVRNHSMPRRSFSFQGLDSLVTETEARRQAEAQARQRAVEAAKAPRSTIDEDLQAWQKIRQQRGIQAKTGPSIDPASYGGFQGAYAPEWRQYTPPSARQIIPQSQRQPSAEQVQGRASSLGQNQAPRQSNGSQPGPGLVRIPSRRLSQPISPRMGLSPGHSGAASPSIHRQGSTPRQGWVGGISPALQSAQRHALENLQQRKSSGNGAPLGLPSAGSKSSSAERPRQPAHKTQTPNRPSSQGAERGTSGGAAPHQRSEPKASLGKKADTSLEDFLMGPELANLAALRALETGTLSSGSPRRSETGRSKTHSGEILNSQPLTKSEKRRKSKEIVERSRKSKEHGKKDSGKVSSSQQGRKSSDSRQTRTSNDLLGSGSQPGSAPVTPRQLLGKGPHMPLMSSGGSGSAGKDGVLRTRSGRTPAERMSQLQQKSENAAQSANPPAIPESAAEGDVQPTLPAPERDTREAPQVLYETPAEKEVLPSVPEQSADLSPASNLNQANLDLKAKHEEMGNRSARLEARRSSAGSSVASQAVPSALFYGVKAPKFATPPKRIAPEGNIIPEIPEERSSKDSVALTPERPSVGFGA